MKQRWRTSGLVLVALVAGCSQGGGPPPQTFPVSGKVVLAGGGPVSGGVVVFHPKDPPANEALGYIAKDGTFKMGTFGREDGALPGRYAVTVEPISNRAPGANTKLDAGVSIPRRYWSAETSDLTAEVRAGDNEVRFTLK